MICEWSSTFGWMRHEILLDKHGNLKGRGSFIIFIKTAWFSFDNESYASGVQLKAGCDMKFIQTMLKGRGSFKNFIQTAWFSFDIEQYASGG